MRQKYLLNHFKFLAKIECTIPKRKAKPMLYLSTIGSLNASLLDKASSYDYPSFLGLQRNFQYTTITQNYIISTLTIIIINIINIYHIINNRMDLEGLVMSKRLKGKQNKKKWNKNIDVSGLLQKIEKSENQQIRKKYEKPLIVEDTTNKIKEDLDPNRFKNRPKSQPKLVYDNSYKRANLIEDGMEDVWDTKTTPQWKHKKQLIVPAIIKPSSGHSYNPRKQDVEHVIDQVIDYEQSKPKKLKKIKKIKQTKVVLRTRNKKLRQQYLMARQRKQERQNLHKIHSAKKIKKQLQEKQRIINQKIEKKQQEKLKAQQQAKVGKVRQGPKLGKKRYEYKQYIPNEEQINKKMSKVSQSDQLLKEQYDSIFRRGIMEPRNVKVHANKTKNIKVTQRFNQD